ncbi:MAG: glycosyltransferase family 39 protein [Nitrospinae bacterium]|nr:glycosyltransferase family 39 protein [Nitrospinota bacterium]
MEPGAGTKGRGQQPAGRAGGGGLVKSEPLAEVGTAFRAYKPFGVGLLLAASSLALRLPLRVPWLGSWDEVDFALGLRRYSLSEYQPHFPGYPVYLGLARLLWPWLGEEGSALTAVNALLGGMTALPLFLLADRLYGRRVALLSSLLLIFNPLHWLLSERALSDVTGSFFILTALCLFSYAPRPYAGPAAGVALALALGTRPSYFPFLLTGAILEGQILRERSSGRGKWIEAILTVFSFLVVCSLWLLWQRVQLGGEPLLAEGLRFTAGHFQSWGGTAWIEPYPLGRMHALLSALFLHGLGFYGPGASPWRLLPSCGIALGLLCWAWGKDHSSRADRFLLAGIIPYFLWICLAQNLSRPRHVLILVLLMLPGVARGLISLLDRVSSLHGRFLSRALLALFLGSSLSLSLDLVRRQQTTPPLALQVLDFLHDSYPGGDSLLYGGEEQRLFEYYRPRLPSKRIRGMSELWSDPLLALMSPQQIFLTMAGEAGGQRMGNGKWEMGNGKLKKDGKSQNSAIQAPPFRVVPIRTFSRDPLLDPSDCCLTLYQLEIGSGKF